METLKTHTVFSEHHYSTSFCEAFNLGKILQADSVAEELVEHVITLYSPEAVGGKADGLMAAEILLQLFDTPQAATVLPEKLRIAALTVITPELLAAFTSEAQTSLVVVRILLVYTNRQHNDLLLHGT